MHMRAVVCLSLSFLGYFATVFAAVANSARYHRSLAAKDITLEARDGGARFTFYETGL